MAMMVVIVRNFKDDPEGEKATVHGPFSDGRDVDTFRDDLLNSALADFCTWNVVELAPATVAAASAPWFG